MDNAESVGTVLIESVGTVLIDSFLYSSVDPRQTAIVFVAKQGDVTKFAGIS